MPISIGSITTSFIDEIEIIVVADGRDDNLDMLKICNNLQSLASSKCMIGLVTIFNPTKLPGKPRNIGIEIAKGKYIGFLDSDDWVDPGFYEKLLDGANKSGHPDSITNTLFSLIDANQCQKSSASFGPW